MSSPIIEKGAPASEEKITMTPVLLKLYICGSTVHSREAVKTVQGLCREAEDEDLCLEIIDVLEQPELAEQDGIIATPTLIKKQPLPARRYVGDFSRLQSIREMLTI